MKRLHLLVSVGLVVAIAAACGGGTPPAPPAPEPNADSIAAAERARQDSIAAAQAEAERRAREEAERIARQREADSLAAIARAADDVRNMLAAMIHFDFDRANIRPDDAATLDQKVAILQANPDLRIRITGHCDERGSDEYNLALGNRRSTAAKQYLVSHGIDASRIETQSYGEERPIAAGSDEDAWAQNRRAEVEIIGGGDMLRRP
ncbi:MAG: peptidoglycan-associated lipoprotein Pal [Gemmatimonadales bacterium]